MYFNLVEMSLLNVEDLISEKGKIHNQFVMPEHISGENGRVVLIGKSGFIVDVIRNIIDYRLLSNSDVINNVNIYAKLNPKSRFFLDKNGNEFKHKITNGNYQP